MKLSLSSGLMIPLRRVEFRQPLNSSLEVFLTVGAGEQHPWPAVQEVWQDGTAELLVEDEAVTEVPLTGTGYLPRIQDKKLTPFVKVLKGVVVKREVKAWLLKKFENGSCVFYQREPEEEAWRFLNRCCGEKLNTNPPEGIDFEQCLPQGAWFLRPAPWTHTTFITALCDHLHHTDNRFEGWVVLSDRIWFLGSCSSSILDVNGWGAGETGAETNPFAGTRFEPKTLRKTLPKDDLVPFLKAMLSADQRDFSWGGTKWPRLPAPVNATESQFCKEIRYVVEMGEPGLSGEAELTLRDSPRSPCASPFRSLEIPAVFEGWDKNEWARLKPDPSFDWTLFKSWGADLVQADAGLFTRLYTLSHFQNNKRSGVFLQYKPEHKVRVDLRPGQTPRVLGVPQLANDVEGEPEIAINGDHVSVNGSEKITLIVDGVLTLKKGEVLLQLGDGSIKFDQQGAISVNASRVQVVGEKEIVQQRGEGKINIDQQGNVAASGQNISLKAQQQINGEATGEMILRGMEIKLN
ncbi:MAG: hypothetical protein ACFCD0_16440 [Gemmataceae bacterium]